MSRAVALSAAVRGRRAAPMDAVSSFGVIAAVIVLFGVSGGLLWVVGYNYEGLTGNPVTKIHPFTYLVGLLFGWRAISSGDPVGYVAHVVHRKPAAAFMALAGIAMLLITVVRKGPGMAGFVDTYVGPSLLVFLLVDTNGPAMRRVEMILHVLMATNAVMALGEFATKTLVFPYRLDGAVFPTDLRSTALQGHPLVNASITACYVLALLTGGRSLSVATRLAMIVLQGAALVVFGGRSGLLVALVFGIAYAAVVAVKSLRSGRVPLLGAAACVLLLTLVPVLVVAVGTTGFFDALLLRFQSDGGSANARVQMLDLLQAIPLRSLIVGPDVGLVESLRRIEGLEWGIENPIVRLVLYQGAFLTLILMVAFGLFMAELAADCHGGVWLPMLGCLLLLNTAESIGSKTTLLAKFAVIVLCLYRRHPPDGAASPVRAAAWSVRARR